MTAVETKTVFFKLTRQSPLNGLAILRDPTRNLSYNQSRPYSPGLGNESDAYVRYIQRPFFEARREGRKLKPEDWQGEEDSFPGRQFCNQKPDDVFWPRPWLVEDPDWMGDKDKFWGKVKENMMIGETNWKDGEMLERNLEEAKERLGVLEKNMKEEAKKCDGPRVYRAGDFIAPYGRDEEDEDDDFDHLYSFEDPQSNSTEHGGTALADSKINEDTKARDGPWVYSAGDLIEPCEGEENEEEEEDDHLYSFEDPQSRPAEQAETASEWRWSDESEELEAMAISSNGEEAESSQWYSYDNLPVQSTEISSLVDTVEDEHFKPTKRHSFDPTRFMDLCSILEEDENKSEETCLEDSDDSEEETDDDDDPRLAQCTWKLKVMAMTPKNLNPPLTGLPALRVTNPSGVIFEFEEQAENIDFDEYFFYDRMVRQEGLQRRLEKLREKEEKEEEYHRRIQAEMFWAKCMAKDEERRRMEVEAVEFEDDVREDLEVDVGSDDISDMATRYPESEQPNFAGVNLVLDVTGAFVLDLYRLNENFANAAEDNLGAIEYQLRPSRLVGHSHECPWYIREATNGTAINLPSPDIPALRIIDPDGNVFELEESQWDFSHPAWESVWAEREEAQAYFQREVDDWRSVCEKDNDRAVRLVSEKWWAECKAREGAERMQEEPREIEATESAHFEEHMAEQYPEEGGVNFEGDIGLPTQYPSAIEVEPEQDVPDPNEQPPVEASQDGDYEEEQDRMSEPDMYCELPEPDPKPRRNSDPELYGRSQHLQSPFEEISLIPEDNPFHEAWPDPQNNSINEDQAMDPDEVFEAIDLTEFPLSRLTSDIDSPGLDADDHFEPDSVFSCPPSRADTRATTPDEDAVQENTSEFALADARLEVEKAQAALDRFKTSAWESVKFIKEAYFEKIRKFEQEGLKHKAEAKSEMRSEDVIALKTSANLVLLQLRMDEDCLKPVDEEGLRLVSESTTGPKEVQFVGHLPNLMHARTGTSFVGLRLVAKWLQKLDVFKKYRSTNHFGDLRSEIDNTGRELPNLDLKTLSRQPIEEGRDLGSHLIRSRQLHQLAEAQRILRLAKKCNDEKSEAEKEVKKALYTFSGEFIEEFAEANNVTYANVESIAERAWSQIEKRILEPEMAGLGREPENRRQVLAQEGRCD